MGGGGRASVTLSAIENCLLAQFAHGTLHHTSSPSPAPDKHEQGFRFKKTGGPTDATGLSPPPRYLHPLAMTRLGPIRYRFSFLAPEHPSVRLSAGRLAVGTT